MNEILNFSEGKDIKSSLLEAKNNPSQWNINKLLWLQEENSLNVVNDTKIFNSDKSKCAECAINLSKEWNENIKESLISFMDGIFSNGTNWYYNSQLNNIA